MKLDADSQRQVDAHLDAIEHVLAEAGAARHERRRVVDEVERQVLDTLEQRLGGQGDPTSADVAAVLAELDPPEAYGPRDTAPSTPGRVDAGQTTSTGAMASEAEAAKIDHRLLAGAHDALVWAAFCLVVLGALLATHAALVKALPSEYAVLGERGALQLQLITAAGALIIALVAVPAALAALRMHIGGLIAIAIALVVLAIPVPIFIAIFGGTAAAIFVLPVLIAVAAPAVMIPVARRYLTPACGHPLGLWAGPCLPSSLQVKPARLALGHNLPIAVFAIPLPLIFAGIAVAGFVPEEAGAMAGHLFFFTLLVVMLIPAIAMSIVLSGANVRIGWTIALPIALALLLLPLPEVPLDPAASERAAMLEEFKEQRIHDVRDAELEPVTSDQVTMLPMLHPVGNTLTLFTIIGATAMVLAIARHGLAHHGMPVHGLFARVKGTTSARRRADDLDRGFLRRSHNLFLLSMLFAAVGMVAWSVTISHFGADTWDRPSLEVPLLMIAVGLGVWAATMIGCAATGSIERALIVPVALLVLMHFYLVGLVALVAVPLLGIVFIRRHMARHGRPLVGLWAR